MFFRLIVYILFLFGKLILCVCLRLLEREKMLVMFIVIVEIFLELLVIFLIDVGEVIGIMLIEDCNSF